MTGGGEGRRRQALALLMAAVGAVAWVSGPALAQAPSRVERTRVMTATRFVTTLQGLEYDLIDALRGGDTAALARLLAPDFEQRSGSAPAAPLARSEWLQRNPVTSPGAVRISDMAVHGRGDLAIASFRQVLAGPGLTQFVVDVWQRNGADGYQLLTRYLSDLPETAAAPALRPDGKR